MARTRGWVCLRCGAGYEAGRDVVPLRCFGCGARLIEMPLAELLERRRAARRHPSASSR